MSCACEVEGLLLSFPSQQWQAQQWQAQQWQAQQWQAQQAVFASIPVPRLAELLYELAGMMAREVETKRSISRAMKEEEEEEGTEEGLEGGLV